MEASTPGDAFAQMLFESIPASEGADPASLTLSNQPGANGERVGMDALRGRQVGDMGFT